MPIEDASVHGIEMQHMPCSLVYRGTLDCEGAGVSCGAVCYNRVY